MASTFLLLANSGQRQRHMQLVSTLVDRQRQDATWDAIRASQAGNSRSAVIFLESPIYVLHLDEHLLLGLGGPSTPQELVVSANARRHLAKRYDRPNADEIRDALSRILYLGHRKQAPGLAELVGRHPRGRLQLVAIELRQSPGIALGAQWCVQTSWWLNESKLRQYVRNGRLRPYRGRAV